MKKLRDVVESKSTKEMKWISAGVYVPEPEAPEKKPIKFPRLISILIPLFFLLSCTDCASTRSITFVETCTQKWVVGELTGAVGAVPLVTYEGRTYVLSGNSSHTWGWRCYQLYPRGLNPTYHENSNNFPHEKDIKDSI